MDRNFRRLLDTLTLIPKDRLISTAEIRNRLEARGHTVTMRTIQRDLFDLADQFGIECDERSKPFGWRWRETAPRLSLPAMDWPAAISLHLVEQHLRELLPDSELERLKPYFDEARKRLHSAFPNVPIKTWPERIRIVLPDQPRLSPRVSRSVHAAVTEALLLGRQIEIQYRSRGERRTATHRIHPLGLVQYGRVYYLAATYYDYADLRMLTFHRIQRARMLDQNVVRPHGFSLDKWIEEGAFGFGGTETIRLVAEFDRDAAWHLLESPLAADQTAQEITLKGMPRTLITATVSDTLRLRWWLLGFGSKVKVRAPAGLKRDIADEHQAAARAYRIDS